MFSLCPYKSVIIFFAYIAYFSTVQAQSWVTGYNYRKKITINKAQVLGKVNLTDFPVLITIISADLKFIPGLCNTNKLSAINGSDIAFAAFTLPNVPIIFQLDFYDPQTGELSCWVKLSSLTSSGNTAEASQLYLYYGSNIIHKPYGPSGMQTWFPGYSKLLHINLDDLEDRVIGSPDLSKDDYFKSKIGNGILLNGTSSYLQLASDTNSVFTFSSWIKLNHIGSSQVIISNDNPGRGGYTLSINGSGKIVFSFYYSGNVYTVSPLSILTTNAWYFVTLTHNKGSIACYLNGVLIAGRAENSRFAYGGNLFIGKSNQNNQFFNGWVDEVRIDHAIRSPEWLKTEYNNQSSPSTFYTVAAEEKNPLQILPGAVFNGSHNDLWTDAANWNSGATPENYMNVTVKGGKTLKSDANQPLFLNNLVVEEGAQLFLKNNLTILCQTNLQINAGLALEQNSKFTIQNALINYGTIYSTDGTGTLSLKGVESYSLTGAGGIIVPTLELDLGSRDLVVTLNSLMSVTNHVDLKTGVVNANGNLTMRSTSLSNTAAVLAVTDVRTASIIGNVNVERYVEGNLPPPSSGRGWRLLSSPVFQNDIPNLSYNILSLKNSAFITGVGGLSNGFDMSPNNGGTVYTHDQSLKGTLAQKYVVFKNINTTVLLGRGIFLFSRGSRTVPNAYADQITSFPFKNPDPYVLTSTGSLFFGNLTIPLFNSKHGEDGDGFNLLGNPYASGIVWGKLIKENTTPFVWMFNPSNNDYIVTDDPSAVIGSGSGFFVKVLKENIQGSITFREDTKVTAVVPAAKALQLAVLSNRKALLNAGRLTVRISRAVFFQDYTIQFLDHGKAEVDDDDALSIGNGYVGISSLVGKLKLAIEKRPLVTEETIVKLSVAGWSAGQYDLSFKGIESFGDHVKVFLQDTYLHNLKEINSEALGYPFRIDPEIPLSQGDGRFSLIFKKAVPVVHENLEPNLTLGPSVYPNPFKDVIHLKNNSVNGPSTNVIIRDFSGKAVFQKLLGPLSAGSVTDLSLNNLRPGFYFLEMKTSGQKQIYKSLKLIKL